MQPCRALHHAMQVPEGLLRVLQGEHLLVTAAGARLGPPQWPASSACKQPCNMLFYCNTPVLLISTARPVTAGGAAQPCSLGRSPCCG